MQFKWTDWPFIALVTILAFALIVFIVVGVDLFPGYTGGRWIALVALTIIAGVLSLNGRS